MQPNLVSPRRVKEQNNVQCYEPRERHYDQLAVSLSNATLHVSVVFAQTVSFIEQHVTLGHGLDDDRCVIVADAFSRYLY